MTDEERMKLDPYGEENWNEEKQNYGLLDHGFTRRFVIPIGETSKEQYIKDMLDWYKKDVKWDYNKFPKDFYID